MVVSGRYHFYCPVKISSGLKALENLPSELKMLNASRPFLLMDSKTGNANQTRNLINAFKTFDIPIVLIDTLLNPDDMPQLNTLAGIFSENACDAVIAAGNGAVADTAKLLNIMVSNRQTDLTALSGIHIEKPLGTFIFVPFSGGTGMEASAYVEIGNRLVSSYYLMPDMVVLDPRMLYINEKKAVVSASLTSLCLAVEAFVKDDAGPVVKTYAHTAIGLIIHHLPLVLKGKNLKNSLLAIANAQVIAAGAFSNAAPGIGFRSARHLSAHCDLHPGVIMAVILPHILAHMQTQNQDLVAELLLPLGGPELYSITAAHLKSQKAINLIQELFHNIGRSKGVLIPDSLKKGGIEMKRVQEALSLFQKDGQIPDDVALILEGAFKGAVH